MSQDQSKKKKMFSGESATETICETKPNKIPVLSLTPYLNKTQDKNVQK